MVLLKFIQRSSVTLPTVIDNNWFEKQPINPVLIPLSVQSTALNLFEPKTNILTYMKEKVSQD